MVIVHVVIAEVYSNHMCKNSFITWYLLYFGSFLLVKILWGLGSRDVGDADSDFEFLYIMYVTLIAHFSFPFCTRFCS